MELGHSIGVLVLLVHNACASAAEQGAGCREAPASSGTELLLLPPSEEVEESGALAAPNEVCEYRSFGTANGLSVHALKVAMDPGRASLRLRIDGGYLSLARKWPALMVYLGMDMLLQPLRKYIEASGHPEQFEYALGIGANCTVLSLGFPEAHIEPVLKALDGGFTANGVRVWANDKDYQKRVCKRVLCQTINSGQVCSNSGYRVYSHANEKGVGLFTANYEEIFMKVVSCKRMRRFITALANSDRLSLYIQSSVNPSSLASLMNRCFTVKLARSKRSKKSFVPPKQQPGQSPSGLLKQWPGFVYDGTRHLHRLTIRFPMLSFINLRESQVFRAVAQILFLSDANNLPGFFVHAGYAHHAKLRFMDYAQGQEFMSLELLLAEKAQNELGALAYIVQSYLFLYRMALTDAHIEQLSRLVTSRIGALSTEAVEEALSGSVHPEVARAFSFYELGNEAFAGLPDEKLLGAVRQILTRKFIENCVLPTEPLAFFYETTDGVAPSKLPVPHGSPEPFTAVEDSAELIEQIRPLITTDWEDKKPAVKKKRFFGSSKHLSKFKAPNSSTTLDEEMKKLIKDAPGIVKNLKPAGKDAIIQPSFIKHNFDDTGEVEKLWELGVEQNSCRIAFDNAVETQQLRLSFTPIVTDPEPFATGKLFLCVLRERFSRALKESHKRVAVAWEGHCALATAVVLTGESADVLAAIEILIDELVRLKSAGKDELASARALVLCEIEELFKKEPCAIARTIGSGILRHSLSPIQLFLNGIGNLDSLKDSTVDCTLFSGCLFSVEALNIRPAKSVLKAFASLYKNFSYSLKRVKADRSCLPVQQLEIPCSSTRILNFAAAVISLGRPESYEAEALCGIYHQYFNYEETSDAINSPSGAILDCSTVDGETILTVCLQSNSLSANELGANLPSVLKHVALILETISGATFRRWGNGGRNAHSSSSVVLDESAVSKCVHTSKHRIVGKSRHRVVLHSTACNGVRIVPVE
ncbi:hypothetical protein PAPHI01_1319 [Pancytospora philotis]|nr:hypothetical protein PAPHI01_1319 [Pancytospora philotis]